MTTEKELETIDTRDERMFSYGKKAGREAVQREVLEALGIYDLIAKMLEEHQDD